MLRGLTIGLFFALTVSGCSTLQAYPGPKRPAEEVALIKGSSFLTVLNPFKMSMRVLQVDDAPLGAFVEKAEILPGEHVVLTSAMSNQHVLQGGVPFEAEAGHTYILKGLQSGGWLPFGKTRFWLWVEDAETEEIVGGEKPK